MSLDPEPRATLSGLSGVELICTPIQSAGSSVVPELVAGDTLFVGSSYKWYTGSDFASRFNDTLPLLVRGCRFHFHEFFCPVDILPTRRIDSTTNKLPSAH